MRRTSRASTGANKKMVATADLWNGMLDSSMSDPRVSVIIPIPPGGECGASLESIRGQDYDKRKIEVLVAAGRHRSIQRNEAIKKSTGEILFFLDNDVTIPDAGYIRRHLEYYQQDENVVSVGGPSLTPATDSLLQRSIGEVLSSYFATQAVRSRYAQLGSVRRTGEAELILCNQSMRARPVRAVGMFDSRLHSGNEENELINRLGAAGYTLIYDPTTHVFRSQRASLKGFVQQIMKYGKSRVEHFMVKPHAFEIKFLVPLGFFCYLLALPGLLWFAPRDWIRFVLVGPLVAYAFLALISAVSVVGRAGWSVACVSFLLFPVHHLSYALGNLYGLFRWLSPEKRTIPATKVERVRL